MVVTMWDRENFHDRLLEIRAQTFGIDSVAVIKYRWGKKPEYLVRKAGQRGSRRVCFLNHRSGWDASEFANMGHVEMNGFCVRKLREACLPPPLPGTYEA